MPCAAPVMIATLPLSLVIWLPLRTRFHSARDPAAVDYEWRAGREGRLVAGEEQCGVRNFVGGSDPAKDRTALNKLWLYSLGTRDSINHRSVDDAGTDAVNAHIVTAVLECRDASHRDHSCFGGTVCGGALDSY